MFKIALDAGHGLYTAGKRCLKELDPKETREWWLNDRICDKIEKKMSVYDDYMLIRVDDTTGKKDIPLEDRVEKANEFGADLYSSMHHNAAKTRISGGGVVVIVDTTASAKSLEYQKIIYENIISFTGLKGNRAIPMPMQNLYVCKHTEMPAVLAEVGFMNSSTDVPIILTEEFAENVADAMVKSYVEIGNLKLKKEHQEDIDMEELEKLKERVKELEEANKVYDQIDETMPKWIQNITRWALDNKMISGTGDGLGMTKTKAETLVMIKNALEK